MTGTIERLTFRNPEEESSRPQAETIRLHRERYGWASEHVVGKDVLDLACGVGYGSAMMAEAGAKSVTGVDISPEAIAEAESSFQAPNLAFFCSDYRLLKSGGAPVPLQEAYQRGFDVAVSLETIEHLPDPADLVRVLHAGLRPGGILIASVPVTPSMDANPFHLQDFSARTFRKMLVGCGFEPLETIVQRQPFNPVTIRNDMAQSKRTNLRGNLAGYYVTHPGKLLLRLYATVRFGFVNIYHVVIARKR